MSAQDIATLRDWTEDVVHAEAVRRVEAEIALLREQCNRTAAEANENDALRDAAEAEVARLRDGLRPFVELLNPDALMQGDQWPTRFHEYQRIARALLANQDGAATNLARPHLDLETKVIPNSGGAA